jgi:hypothetical protein
MITYTGSVEVGSGRVGLNVDTGNFAWGGHDQEQSCRDRPRRSTCTLRTSSGWATGHGRRRWNGVDRNIRADAETR